MQKTKVRFKRMTALPACVIGVAAALILTVCGALAGAICILNEYFDITVITAVTIITQLTSALVGSFLAGRFAKENKILSCCLTVSIYYFVLLGVAMLFFDGIGSGVIAGLVVCALSCLGGLLLSTREKNNRKHKRKGKRTC